MTLGQWLAHLWQWFYATLHFPLPWRDIHLWTGVVGEREQTCLICGRQGMDRSMTDEELEEEKKMSAAYEVVHDQLFGKGEDV